MVYPRLITSMRGKSDYAFLKGKKEKMKKSYSNVLENLCEKVIDVVG